MLKQLTLALGLLIIFEANLPAEDWPQWMGLNRDGIYRETGLVARIPDSGLPEKWRVPVAAGYSGPAVAEGRVFLTDFVKSSGNSTNNPDGRDKLAGTERVLCLDANTGRELWRVEDPREYNISYANGPRATPTVDGDRVYVLGAEGDLVFATFSPAGFEELGRMHLLEPTSEGMGRPVVWSHPAIANKCLFARNDKELVCISLASQ